MMRSRWLRGGKAPSHADEKGFTVVEMVVTCAVILVVVAIAVPAMKDAMASYRLRGAVATVTGAIQSTRYQAIYQGYAYQVVFDATGKTYQVQRKPIGSAAFSNVGTPVLWSESVQAVTLDANATLTFSPGGRVQGAAACPCQMTLTYPGRTPEVITVSAYGNINVNP